MSVEKTTTDYIAEALDELPDGRARFRSGEVSKIAFLNIERDGVVDECGAVPADSHSSGPGAAGVVHRG